LFAQAPIPERKKLGELTGEVISEREARRRAKDKRRIVMVELGNGKAIDGSRRGNEFQYVNHSCSPNTFIRILGNRVEIYALRSIRRGEELTCDYGETQHDGARRCRCASQNCRRFI
jgi:hypothetical protein